MGFDPQLHEILHRLPSDRQSLLFSATLPSSVAEFAKAGLNNPILIRLDTEHKVSPDLSLSFLSVKPHEKDAGLLVLLDRILEIRSDPRGEGESTQAIIFVSTKHHVEYVTTLLATAGYRVAHVYGSLDQVARQRQLETFRTGEKAVLVVTDVAARGLDIPVLENVVNFDFPSSSRVFVHRVGRTARAGRKGAAWSLVTRDDMPYFLDLEIFLGPIIGAESCPCAHMPQNLVDDKVEYILHSLDEASPQLALLRQVMLKGQAMFDRSRSKASRQAYRAAKANDKCIGPGGHFSSTHPAFALAKTGEALGDQARLIASVDRYRPNETVLEIRARGQNTSSHLMQARRRLLDRRLKPPDQRLEGEHDQHTVVLTPIQVSASQDSQLMVD